MLAVGSFIAGYRVERLLGTGGMGAVYLVSNPELPRREALKLLSTELSHDAGFRARFIREADVAARLEHPNIVSVHRRGQTADGQLWIAMQFVDGIDADRALRQGQMSPDRAIHIIGEVAKALDHAHRHNVVHRDVKPANFLLSGPVGAEERVLLGDFGIARALDDASVTGTGEVIASLSYVAPEVIAGGPIDGRADLYSLGCALFRMLTGTAPFPAGGAAAVMMAHLLQPPPRVSEHAPWLPPALDEVIVTAMSKEPAHRFASGAKLAAAVRAALYQGAGRSTASAPIAPPAPPPQAYTPPAPRRRGRRALVAALIAGFTLAAGIVAVSTWRSSGHAPTSAQPTASTTSSAATTTPPPPVSAAALSGLLLSNDELSTVMGVPMQTAAVLDVMADNSQSISDVDCLGAYSSAETAAYAGSGWSAVRTQATQPPVLDFVAQTVVAFPSIPAAENLYARRVVQWAACAGRPFTVQMPEGLQSWVFGQSGIAEGMLTITANREGDDPRSCGRVMSIRANVVIDVSACKPSGLTTQAVDIAAKITAKVLG